MKIIIYAFFMASLISNYAGAQKLKDNEVPEVVKKNFNLKFSNAKEVKWSKESSSEFEAEFETGELEQSASFDVNGKWLITETEIKFSQLPKAVQTAIAKEFPGYKIEESETAISADQGSFFEVELKKGKISYEVQLTTEGKIINKEEMKAKGGKKD